MNGQCRIAEDEFIVYIVVNVFTADVWCDVTELVSLILFITSKQTLHDI